MEKIAVIGIGIMGNGIANNFLKHGYEVIVWNRHQDKLKELQKKGALVAKTPKEASQIADIIFEVTANDQSSKSVWTGENGIISGANPGKIVIASSTLSIDWTDKLAELAKNHHLIFFDIPLTGGRSGAEEGKLTLLAGGDKLKLDKIKKDLQAISENIWYFGNTGSGMRFKLILNSLQAIHVLGFGEMMNIAKKVGLDQKLVGQALSQKPGGGATVMAWNDFINEPHQVNFAVKWITKDLNYTKKMIPKVNTPILNGTLSKLRKAIYKKLGEKNWTNLNKIDLN